MKRKLKKETLIKKIEECEEKLHQERLRLHGVIDNYGFGHAMRCVKCTPSFSKEDKILTRIEEYKRLLAEYEK